MVCFDKVLTSIFVPMKELIIILFFLFQITGALSQDNGDCSTTTSETLSGDVYDYDLAECTKDVKIITTGGNTTIHGITFINALETINIVATEDDKISIKPNDAFDYINITAHNTLSTIKDDLDEQATDRTDRGNNKLGEKNLNNDLEVILYPIPADTTINIQTDLTIHYYRIANQHGLIVQQGLIPSSKAIQIEKLTSGIYYILLETENDYTIESFTKN